MSNNAVTKTAAAYAIARDAARAAYDAADVARNAAARDVARDAYAIARAAARAAYDAYALAAAAK